MNDLISSQWEVFNGRQSTTNVQLNDLVIGMSVLLLRIYLVES